MYHEATYEDLHRARLRRVAVAVAVALACLAAALAYRSSREVARAQGAAALRSSILEAALQCCAVEGSFPSELSHLEEHYGLYVNDGDYVVGYEWLGDNIAPSVVVRQR